MKQKLNYCVLLTNQNDFIVDMWLPDSAIGLDAIIVTVEFEGHNGDVVKTRLACHPTSWAFVSQEGGCGEDVLDEDGNILEYYYTVHCFVEQSMSGCGDDEADFSDEDFNNLFNL